MQARRFGGRQVSSKRYAVEKMDALDFNNATFDDLDQYAMEKLVFDTGELSPILKGHLFIERVLETLISNNVPHPETLFKKHRLTCFRQL